ncbi:MAG: pyridoxamine 5'-phosphate oxidase family protein, partial [Firmicutes bacterium]|nr:pyridoxamine 5'-phosphate oxidase family protein [Bacillota bacterium]
MFRELTRIKQQISTEECIQVLKEETRGVLSVNGDDGYPYGMPMNHWYNEEDGAIYFHSGKKGYRPEVLKKDNTLNYPLNDAEFELRRKNDTTSWLGQLADFITGNTYKLVWTTNDSGTSVESQIVSTPDDGKLVISTCPGAPTSWWRPR